MFMKHFLNNVCQYFPSFVYKHLTVLLINIYHLMFINIFQGFVSFSSDLFNTLTVNYEVTRKLRSLLGCQTTSYLMCTNVEKSNCRFMASFLKIAAAVNVFIYLKTYQKLFFKMFLKQ